MGGGVRFLPQGYIYILGTSVPSFTLGQTDGFDHTKLRLPRHEGYRGRRVRLRTHGAGEIFVLSKWQDETGKHTTKWAKSTNRGLS